MLLDVEEKIGTLEAVLGQYIVQTNKMLNRMERDSIEFKMEMKEFKDEMKEFKDEMKEFKDEMKEFKDEMKEFKDEMKEFKDEMKEFKDETRNESKRMNLQWGHLANKMGTLVEDMVIPSLPSIIEGKFNLSIEDIQPRRKKRHPKTKEIKEYDCIIITEDAIFLNSTKSTLKIKDVDEFITEINDFREYFPEYRNKEIIGVLSTLYPEKTLIDRAESLGFLVIGIGDWLMELKNSEGFIPKKW
jgi:predicted nuclease with TOPRIM domain